MRNHHLIYGEYLPGRNGWTILCPNGKYLKKNGRYGVNTFPQEDFFFENALDAIGFFRSFEEGLHRTTTLEVGFIEGVG